MYFSDRYSIMDRNILLDDYWKDQLAEVYEHIKRDCAPGDYDWNRRGIIVADDETGELLALVKGALKYEPHPCLPRPETVEHKSFGRTEIHH